MRSLIKRKHNTICCVQGHQLTVSRQASAPDHAAAQRHDGRRHEQEEAAQQRHGGGVHGVLVRVRQHGAQVLHPGRRGKQRS